MAGSKPARSTAARSVFYLERAVQAMAGCSGSDASVDQPRNETTNTSASAGVKAFVGLLSGGE
jgi:hypothetical protein